KGLDHVAENILSYLDAESLYSAELVCKEWNRVISEGMLWKKLIERKVRTDSIWRGLAERRGWIQYLFKPKPGESHPDHCSYRSLFPKIIQDIEFSGQWSSRVVSTVDFESGVWLDVGKKQGNWEDRKANNQRLWDIECGACLRVLEGHE
ncbi:beta-TrCP-like, partial [Diaphorina citri]|uniref:Beta-TrCP-like n=1 Tax=Diaphorina citri TaxID=121845 RepID=A0A1S3DPQ6_DIACI